MTLLQLRHRLEVFVRCVTRVYVACFIAWSVCPEGACSSYLRDSGFVCVGIGMGLLIAKLCMYAQEG